MKLPEWLVIADSDRGVKGPDGRPTYLISRDELHEIESLLTGRLRFESSVYPRGTSILLRGATFVVRGTKPQKRCKKCGQIV